MEYTFPVTRNEHPKLKPTDESALGFGKNFTDHMLIMEYDEGQGWHDGRIIPYGPISFDPGVTRDSTIQLLRKWGIKVEERRILGFLR